MENSKVKCAIKCKMKNRKKKKPKNKEIKIFRNGEKNESEGCHFLSVQITNDC